jgi:hypothetical protein
LRENGSTSPKPKYGVTPRIKIPLENTKCRAKRSLGSIDSSAIIALRIAPVCQPQSSGAIVENFEKNRDIIMKPIAKTKTRLTAIPRCARLLIMPNWGCVIVIGVEIP